MQEPGSDFVTLSLMGSIAILCGDSLCEKCMQTKAVIADYFHSKQMFRKLVIYLPEVGKCQMFMSNLSA